MLYFSGVYEEKKHAANKVELRVRLERYSSKFTI